MYNSSYLNIWSYIHSCLHTVRTIGLLNVEAYSSLQHYCILNSLRCKSTLASIKCSVLYKHYLQTLPSVLYLGKNGELTFANTFKKLKLYMINPGRVNSLLGTIARVNGKDSQVYRACLTDTCDSTSHLPYQLSMCAIL